MISEINNSDRIKNLAVMSLNLEKHKTDFKRPYKTYTKNTNIITADRQTEIEDYCDCLKHTSPTVVWPESAFI